MCSVSCRESMRGTNLSLCKQRRGTGFMINVTGHLNMDRHAHVRECTHTNVRSITHYSFFFSPLTWQWGMERLKFLLCCDKSRVSYGFFFCFLYLHPWLWLKNKKCKMKMKIKTEKKHRKIRNIVLHLADGQYIFSVLLVLFVTSMWHHYPFCWCVEVRLWVPGSGPAPSCQLHSIP